MNKDKFGGKVEKSAYAAALEDSLTVSQKVKQGVAMGLRKPNLCFYPREVQM